MKRKFLIGLTVICLVLISVFSLSACGENDSDYNGEVSDTIKLNYTLSDDGTFYAVSADTFDKRGTKAIIPSTYNGLPVELISNFQKCTSLTSVTIPDSVKLINGGAFYGCTSLTSITIPDSVTSIGEAAFRNCTSLQYNTYDNAKYLGNESNPYLALIDVKSSSITSCKIHEDTKLIAYRAFSGCSSLQYNTYDNAKYLGNENNP